MLVSIKQSGFASLIKGLEMRSIKDKVSIWTCFLIAALTLCTSVAVARNTSFAWDASPTWPAGTTVELEANGASASGITGPTHTIDVPVQPGGLITARARAIPPAGYECGDPLVLCPPSPWSESLVATVPPDPTGLQATIELVGGGSVMAAPTNIFNGQTTYNSGGNTSKTINVTVQTGDVLIVAAQAENFDADTSVSITVSGGGLTWTSAQTVAVNSYGYVRLYYATATSNATFDITLTATGTVYSGYTVYWGGSVKIFRGSDGVGASSKTNVSSGAPTLNITTTQANSAICVFNNDWNSVDGASRTWRTGAGSLTETTYFRDAARYSVYSGYHADAGSTGTKAVGLSAPSGQKYSIVAVEVKGGAGATTVTATTGLNALLQKTGITATSSLSALLQKSFSGTVSLDSIISAVKSGTVSIDALLQATDKSATVSVDGLLQAVKTGAVSIDAAIAIIVSATSGIDALLQNTFNATAGLDAIISGSSTVTASLDGLLQSGKSTTALLDALLQSGYLSQTDLDAIISKSFSSTASIDALLQSVSTTPTGLDAIISGGSSASVVLDALLQAGVVSTAAIDALLKKSASSTASLDAFIQGSASAVASLDALIQATKTGTLSLDAIIVSAGQALATTSLDGLLQAVKSGTISLDAMVAVPVAGATVGLDALLSMTRVSTVSIGALLQATKTGMISIDGLVQSAKTAQVSIDGLIQAARTGTLSLDAIVGIIGSSSVSLDAIMQKSRASGIFIDAIIGLISAIIMPTGRVISIAPTDRFIVISETDRFIVIPNSDRSVVN